MKSFKNNIYEELIADNRFIEWVSGNDKSDYEYWENWKDNHPKFQIEFEEAKKTVQLLQFQPPDISNSEIKYIWDKTDKRLNTIRQPLSPKTFLSWMVRVAAILVIPLIIAVIWLYQDNLSIRNNFAEVSKQSAQKAVTINAPLGGMVNFQLPDGSRVWLDAGSEITYPAYFNSDKREVSLIGQAYFEIEKGDIPFFVNNTGPTVKVYGTEFNVSAFDNEDNVTVALVEGKVSLNVNNKEVFLKPGEISKFKKIAHSLEIVEANIDQYVKWKDGVLIFRDASLETIIRTLERRYNTSIHIENKDIANYKYNATLMGENINQVLNLLILSAPIKYRYIQPKQKEDFSYTKAQVFITKDDTRIMNQ